MSTQRKNVSTLTSFVVSHVPKFTRLSLRLSARSKVTRVEFVRGEGEPGNEARLIRYLFADSAKTTVSRDAVAPPLIISSLVPRPLPPGKGSGDFR